MIALSAFGLWLMRKKKLEDSRRYLLLLPFAIFLPQIANTTGWIFTEMGRQPWIVFGLQKTEEAASPIVSSAAVLATIIGFGAIYGLLLVVEVKLILKYVKAGPPEVDPEDIPVHAY